MAGKARATGSKKATEEDLQNAIESGDQEAIQSIMANGIDGLWVNPIAEEQDEAGFDDSDAWQAVAAAAAAAPAPTPVSAPIVSARTITATQLGAAIKEGDLNAVQSYLDNGGGVDEKDSNGYTPLHNAALWGKEDIAQLLLDRDAALETKNRIGNTAQVIAAQNKDRIGVLRRLLDKGARLDAKSDLGNTGLIMAGRNGLYDSAEMIIKEAVRRKELAQIINEKNDKEQTALLEAASAGHTDVVRLLVEANAALDEQNKEGDTALITTVYISNCDIADLLIQKGAALEIKNKKGETALLAAARLGKADVARRLIKAGANIYETDNAGRTAQDLAQEKYPGIAEMIEEIVEANRKAEERAIRLAENRGQHVSAMGRQQIIREHAAARVKLQPPPAQKPKAKSKPQPALGL